MDTHYSNHAERKIWPIHLLEPSAALTVTGDLTVGGTSNLNGTILVDSLLNDETEDKIVTWNSTDKTLEYRQLSNFNPFDQELNTTNEVLFDRLSLRQNGQAGRWDMETNNDDMKFSQTTPANFNSGKTCSMETFVNDAAETFRFKVENKSSFAGTKVNLTLDSQDQRIIEFDKGAYTNGFKLGHDYTTDAFYITLGPDNNIQNGAKMTIDNTGDVILDNLTINNVPQDDLETRLLVLDTPFNTVSYRDVSSLPANNPFDQDLNIADSPEFNSITITPNMVISTTDENNQRIVSNPAIETAPGSFLVAGYSDQHYQFIVSNENTTAGSHSMLTLTSDGTSSNLGGNNLIQMGNAGGTTDTWNIGKKKTDSTFRFNYGNADYLQEDGNTQMKLSTTGVLSLKEHVDIDATNVDLMTIVQTPNVLTGAKELVYQSETDNSAVEFVVQNRSTNVTGHAAILLQTDRIGCTGQGGNQCIIYDSCSAGGWTAGRQKSTNTFRWNYSVGAGGFLTLDSNTRMFLDTAGNLTITGTLNQSGVALSVNAPYYAGVETTGAGAKVKRTGVTLNNNSTLNLFSPVTLGVNYPMQAGVVRNFTFGTEWTNVGSTLTYVGADIIYVHISGSMSVSGTSGDVIQVSILVNGIVYSSSTTTVNGAQRHNMGCSYVDQVISGQTISLQAANLTASRNFNVHCGHLSVSSF